MALIGLVRDNWRMRDNDFEAICGIWLSGI
jgi:hypothetical protein